MKHWLGWLPLLLWGMAACAPTSNPIPDIILSTVAETSTPVPTPPVAEATPTSIPTPAPVTDKIAFASTRSANEKPDIYLMNSDGSGLARLTDHPAGDTHPAWSPDRQQIAFVSDRSGANQLYLMAPDGSNQEVLTDQPAAASAPAWSPDGRRIAFIDGAGDEPRLAILNLADKTVAFPDISLTDPTHISWAPDGFNLAIVAADPAAGGSRDIFLINLESTQPPVNLTHHPGDDEFPAWSSDGKRLAFQTDRDGNDEVYVMYANGSAQTPLTHHPASDGQPTWAGDNRRLAFVSDRTGQPTIYVMADNGGDPTALTASSLPAVAPSWQPAPPAPFIDILVYVATDSGLRDLYTVNVNGTGQQNLTRDPGLDDTMPAWSPDGSQIAFASNQTGDYDIFVWGVSGAQDQADVAGSTEEVSERVNLTNNPAKDMHPAWSPDGSQLAFESDRSGQWQVWVMGSDGSNLRQLTTGPADSGNPAWSPDGSQIAFASNRTGNFDLYLVNVSGGEPDNLTRTPANEFYPAWSPQGDQLAFRSDQDDNRQIYVIDAKGGSMRRLLYTTADDDQPVWSPDGRRIAFVSNRALGSDGQRSRQPSPSYALYVFDLETRETRLVAGEAGVEIQYPSWKPRQ